MDYYVPRAWRLLMVAEPLERMPSLFYFEAGYTYGVFNTALHHLVRKVDNETFSQPQSPAGRAAIQRFLASKAPRKWAFVQWNWLAEGTPDRTLAEVKILLENGAFLVGLREKFDESLMLWRHFMGLFVEDIVYAPFKAGFPHPKLTEWHPEERAAVERIVSQTGDKEYFRVVQRVFEHQVTLYGGWDKLNHDTKIFREVNFRLQQLCEDVASTNDGGGVNRVAVCMVAKYRQLKMAQLFNEL